jgi:hypothetical protein
MYIRPKNLYKAGEDEFYLKLTNPGKCEYTGYKYMAEWQPVTKKNGVWFKSGPQFFMGENRLEHVPPVNLFVWVYNKFFGENTTTPQKSKV